MPSDDRDPKFERALAHHLRGGPPSAGCPDAEILAAYHQRTLSLDEMAQWKMHIAGCAACQETFSLVEATEKQLAEDWEGQEIPVLAAAAIYKPRSSDIPVQSAALQATPQADAAPVVMKPRRRPVLMRWAIPLGAVAAGVLIWIGIHEQSVLQAPHSTGVEVAQNQQAPAAQDQKLTKPEPNVPPPMERDSRQAEMESKTGRLDAILADREQRQLSPAAPKAGASNLAKDAGNAKKESSNQVTYAGRGAAPEIPSAKIVPGASADKLTAENRPATVAPPPPAPAAAGGAAGGLVGGRTASSAAPAPAPPHAITQTVEVTSAAPTVDTSTAATARQKAKAEQQAAADLNTNAMMMKQGVASQMVQVIGSDPGLILTPDNKVWWKLQPGGMVELTTNGGKKWKSLNTVATSDLTAGFAPSDRICWIAGKAGTLILTTDRGGHWTRITIPITGDLGGVHASDAKHASIWDAANHTSYETSDGGATWKQTANE